MFPDINQQFDFYRYISPKLTEYLSEKSKLKFSIVIMEIFMLYSGNGISLTIKEFENFYSKINPLRIYPKPQALMRLLQKIKVFTTYIMPFVQNY